MWGREGGSVETPDERPTRTAACPWMRRVREVHATAKRRLHKLLHLTLFNLPAFLWTRKRVFAVASSTTCVLIALALLNGTLVVYENGLSLHIRHEGLEDMLLESDAASAVIIQNAGVRTQKQQLQKAGGKYCVFVRSSWKCYECAEKERGQRSRSRCRKLKRARRKCYKPMSRKPWHVPPQAYSSYDPLVVDDVQMRTLREVQESVTVYLKQPMCDIASCFNLSKCDADVLTVYTNETNTSKIGSHLLHHAVNHSKLLKKVLNPDDACLNIIFADTYVTSREMFGAEHWQPRGRNNLLWDMGEFHMSPWTGDRVFQRFHYDYAAVASQALTGPVFRMGYDQVLPLRRQWQRRADPNDVDIHRPRRWLLSFRGDIQHNGIPYYNHRWLASEYWEIANDIFVDVQCRKDRKVYQPYDFSADVYDQIMWNSTFGFAPGGAGVSSYRLGEYLSTGTIPVVVSGTVAPFAPELNWSGCWIVVAESRIVDLPRILRQISESEIRHRQMRCWELHGWIWGDKPLHSNDNATVGGWVSDPRVIFTRGMVIWATRIANAIEANKRLQQTIHSG